MTLVLEIINHWPFPNQLISIDWRKIILFEQEYTFCKRRSHLAITNEIILSKSLIIILNDVAASIGAIIKTSSAETGYALCALHCSIK